MLITALLVPKDSLTVATVDFTLEEALTLMEEKNVRCLPVLDKTKTLFQGNIYRYHIYRHIANGGKTNVPIVLLLKNATKFIYQTDSFFSLFFTLTDLPYISVLNKENHFVGIIYHKDVMTMLSQSWNLSHSSYTLNIELLEDGTSFLNALKIIKKYTHVTNVLTFERDTFLMRKRILVTLPEQLDEIVFDKLKRKLAKHHFRIIEIEDLTHGI